ncbi:MAG: peroxiredoxin-like family protein [Blastocatellia bacterium]
MKKQFVLGIFFASLFTVAAFGQSIVTADQAAQSALKTGADMPSFALKDANGVEVKSSELMKKGNLVVVFYRGAWCPLCNTYLRTLQKSLAEIKQAGGVLVAISAENPDNSLGTAKKNEIEFSVLSDPNLDLARKFGLVYQLPNEVAEKYVSYGIDLKKRNAMEKPELPISATYVIDQKGKIAYAFAEPNYQKRAEPAAIIEALSKIRPKN